MESAILCARGVLRAGPARGKVPVYHSRDACLQVLEAVRTAKPAWWDADADVFIDRVANVPTADALARQMPDGFPLVAVVEGLDGVGKTTVTQHLASRNRGVVVRTPDPGLDRLRAHFRDLDESVSRAFYCAANYLAAEEIAKLALPATQATAQPDLQVANHLFQYDCIIVDRWWCSTCAMALANTFTLSTLPDADDTLYRWPEDLLKFDVGVLLSVSEEIRMQRWLKRGSSDAEEKKLAQMTDMRATAMEAYRRSRLLVDVDVPNYGAAVNAVLREMQKSSRVSFKGNFFSAEEVAAIPSVGSL